MAQHELSQVLSKYLDRHLIFPLLEFLQEKGIYNELDVLKAKLALLDKTNMVDFAMDIFKSLNGCDEVPAAMKEHRSEVVARLRQLQQDVEPIIKCLQNPQVEVLPSSAASLVALSCVIQLIFSSGYSFRW
jgi:translation initiation factor 3 subunit E